MTTPPTKLGIAIDWYVLRDRMKEYLNERGSQPEDEELTRQLVLSDFLIWLSDEQKRVRRQWKEMTNGTANNEARSNS